jgi:hypothetical protein
MHCQAGSRTPPATACLRIIPPLSIAAVLFFYLCDPSCSLSDDVPIRQRSRPPVKHPPEKSVETRFTWNSKNGREVHGSRNKLHQHKVYASNSSA